MDDFDNLPWIIAARERKCPGCGAPDMIPGPRGGASQNFYCVACNHGWNLHGVDYGVIGVQDIGTPDPENVAHYRALAESERANKGAET